MSDEDAIAMVLDIVAEVDYDIYKCAFNKETAEEPEEVDNNINRLLDIVKNYVDICTEDGFL